MVTHKTNTRSPHSSVVYRETRQENTVLSEDKPLAFDYKNGDYTQRGSGGRGGLEMTK